MLVTININYAPCSWMMLLRSRVSISGRELLMEHVAEDQVHQVLDHATEAHGLHLGVGVAEQEACLSEKQVNDQTLKAMKSFHAGPRCCPSYRVRS